MVHPRALCICQAPGACFTAASVCTAMPGCCMQPREKESYTQAGCKDLRMPGRGVEGGQPADQVQPWSLDSCTAHSPHSCTSITVSTWSTVQTSTPPCALLGSRCSVGCRRAVHSTVVPGHTSADTRPCWFGVEEYSTECLCGVLPWQMPVLVAPSQGQLCSRQLWATCRWTQPRGDGVHPHVALCRRSVRDTHDWLHL